MSHGESFLAAKKAIEGGDACSACKQLCALVEQEGALTKEEESLLFAAFKEAAGKCRQALHKDETDSNAKEGLAKCCAQAINCLDKALAKATKPASKVFLNKSLGDFRRYLEEAQPDPKNKAAALQCYKTAASLADGALPPVDPLRLNVALNYGVYCQDIMGDTKLGLKITNDAIEAARPALEGLEEKDKTPTSFVLSMLYDNSKLWSKELKQSAPPPIEGLVLPKAAAQSQEKSPQPRGTPTVEQAQKPKVQA